MTTYIQTPSKYGSGFAESIVEDVTLEILGGLGYSTAHGSDIAPDTSTSERQGYGDVILRARFEAAVDRLNPAIPANARAEAIAQVFSSIKNKNQVNF